MESCRLNNRGFTLLELLIAITMLTFITGIMAGALHMTHRSLEKGEKKIHYLERARASISVVEAQIQSIFPFLYTDDDGQKKILFSGQKDKMVFYSKYSLWGGAKGYSLVTYEIKLDDKGKQLMKVTEKMMGLEAINETDLFTNCDSINFEYYLKNVFEEGKWVEEWPADERRLPEKIRINVADDKKRTVLVAKIWTKGITLAPTAAPVVSK